MNQPATELPVTVVELAADALQTPMEELPPLTETIDPEALAALVPSRATDASSDVTITFTYAGLRIVVRSGRTVYVQPSHGDREEWVEWTPRDK